jgi:hypothetical protein
MKNSLDKCTNMVYFAPWRWMMIEHENNQGIISKAKPRLSITIPKEQYEKLQELAQKNRVSLAWVIRDAVETYLDDENTDRLPKGIR